MQLTTCPCCGAHQGKSVYRVARTPANSCLLICNEQEARDFPCGVLDLACCHGCGFLWNASFDPRLIEYSERYEETQGFSPTFERFHRHLALDLIERYALRGKRVLEIGCGKGEFLALLSELGECDGIGFDPAYRPGRVSTPTGGRLRFVPDLYSERYAEVGADFICCKMTLEHIAEPRVFVQMLRRTIGSAADVVVFFLLPDGGRIMEEGAFEDIYYEHCSYFSRASLGRLFDTCGFHVHSLESVYGGQYLALAVSPRGEQEGAGTAPIADLATHLAAVESFSARGAWQRRRWQERLREWQREGARTVLWGSGSKAVGFLTAVAAPDSVAAVVDINPHKAGSFMAGSGLPIVAPAELVQLRPDRVIVMNAIYHSEIAAQVQQLGVTAEVVTLRQQGEQEVTPT